MNRKEFQLQVLEREVASNKQLYDLFMGRAKEMDAGSDIQAAVARVVDPAVVARNMRALQRLGDPYTDEEIEGAAAAVSGKSEMDALIAYLQGLGKHAPKG